MLILHRFAGESFQFGKERDYFSTRSIWQSVRRIVIGVGTPRDLALALIV